MTVANLGRRASLYIVQRSLRMIVERDPGSIRQGVAQRPDNPLTSSAAFPILSYCAASIMMTVVNKVSH